MLIKYTVDHWKVDLGLDSSLAVDRFGTSRELNGLHLRGELIQCTSQQKLGLDWINSSITSQMVSWCSWLSRQSNTLKVPRSSLGEIILLPVVS
jgi:hypothetical protein